MHGFDTPLRVRLDHRGMPPLPLYVPTIQHGSSRTRPLQEEWVALPLYGLFGGAAGSYRPVAESGDQLRKLFKLAKDTRILALGVAEDPELEQFWEHHQAAGACAALKRMGVDAVTVPNFSYFTDAPPPHTLYNRSRMLRMAERLAEAGLGAIPHLNGFEPQHWDFWLGLLREQPDCRFICKEFATGLRVRERGDLAYVSLVQLQQKLGRPLHPVLVAGRRHLPRLRRDFQSFTLIDSVPFMRTLKRQKIILRDGKVKWRLKRTLKGEPVDDRLEANIKGWRSGLERRASQDSFPFYRTMPPSPPRPPQQPVESLELFAAETNPKDGEVTLANGQVTA